MEKQKSESSTEQGSPSKISAFFSAVYSLAALAVVSYIFIFMEFKQYWNGPPVDNLKLSGALLGFAVVVGIPAMIGSKLKKESMKAALFFVFGAFIYFVVFLIKSFSQAR